MIDERLVSDSVASLSQNTNTNKNNNEIIWSPSDTNRVDIDIMNDSVLHLAALANELESLISASVPGANTVSKYGGMLFTLKPEEKEGQFCGLFVYKDHVQLSFSQGALLKDPEGLLAGNGKKRRHINFTSLDQVDVKELENLIVQSVEL